MGKYLREVLTHMPDDESIEWHLLGDRPETPFHPPAVPNLNVSLFNMPGFRFHTWEQVALPIRARRLGADLLHAPAMSLPWWQPMPTVVTLHDAMPWIGSELGWAPGWYRDRVLPAAFNKCAAIITVSESSRDDIIRIWPDLDSKLHVIPNGVTDAYLDAPAQPVSTTLASLGVRRPYLLYVGGDAPRKRFPWAVDVFTQLADGNLTLVACGIADRSTREWVSQLPSEISRRIVLLPFIDEADMPGLYMNSVAVLYPTLYEGFGLPALEAQAVGAPVLFSDVKGLTELKGPGAVVVPADDVHAWVSSIRELAAGGVAYRESDRKSRDWARGFSWSAAALRTLTVYRNALSQGSRA